MITHFQRVIHRHGRWIFSILLGIIIVAFIFWGSAGLVSRNDRSMPGVPLVYGRSVSPRDLDRIKRLILFLSGHEMRMTQELDAMLQNQILLRMAMVEKAGRMGITVTDEEIIAKIRQAFSKRNGEYDDAAYTRFLNEGLFPRGFGISDFENSIREDVLLSKLIQVIASTVKITPEQAKAFAGEISEKLNVLAYRFELEDFTAQVRPSDEELATFYKQHPDYFRIPEKVKVSYVTFPLNASKVTVTDQELKEAYESQRHAFTGPDGKVKSLKEVSEVLRFNISRQKAYQVAMERASEFSVQCIGGEGKPPPPFGELAKKNGLQIKQTDFFGPNEISSNVPSREFASAAFKLSTENPTTDPIPFKEAVYVANLIDKKPGEMPPFEQVKGAVKTAFTAEAALKLARETGEKKRKELLDLLASGKSVEKAAEALKLKSQSFKGFSAIDSLPKDAYEGAVQRVSFQIPAGAASSFIPNTTGGFFVCVVSRQPAKPEEVQKLAPQIQQVMLQMQQKAVIQDFQESVLQEAGIPSRSSVSERDS